MISSYNFTSRALAEQLSACVLIYTIANRMHANSRTLSQQLVSVLFIKHETPPINFFQRFVPNFPGLLAAQTNVHVL